MAKGCFSWILILTGLSLWIWAGYDRKTAAESRHWPTIEAVNTSQAPAQDRTLTVTVEYTVNGRPYKHTELKQFATAEQATAAFQSYQGRKLRVAYNPADPEQYTESPGKAEVSGRFSLGLLLVLGGLVLLALPEKNGARA